MRSRPLRRRNAGSVTLSTIPGESGSWKTSCSLPPSSGESTASHSSDETRPWPRAKRSRAPSAPPVPVSVAVSRWPGTASSHAPASPRRAVMAARRRLAEEDSSDIEVMWRASKVNESQDPCKREMAMVLRPRSNFLWHPGFACGHEISLRSRRQLSFASRRHH